jgi:outer membrane protein assembly factor BamD
MMVVRYILAVSLLLSLGACSLFSHEKESPDKRSAELLYKEGKASLESGDYKAAIQKFETLEARFPFGHYAQQALLETAYAYYKFDETDSAISTADRFIKLYPRQEHVDYAYYLRGLASYNLSKSFLDRTFSVDLSERDPKRARQSFQYFSELVQRFPNSKYSVDAIQRMIYLKNSLANYEVHVADYYFKRGAYLAAANRAKYVVDNYNRTPSVPDALRLMVKSYQKLGLAQLADDTQKILELNYPDKPAPAGEPVAAPLKEMPPPAQTQEQPPPSNDASSPAVAK